MLQILGSGGPIADDARSSTAYLIWVDGRARILVDVGGGAFLRFGEAGARFEDLDSIAISHFHTDHSADLVTLLKTGYFSNRKRALEISGPDARGPFPGLSQFLSKLIGDDGAYAYLSGYLDGSGGLVQLETMTLDPDVRRPMRVFGDDDSPTEIEAIGIPHGIVPALAYRVRIGDKVVVFAGDQNGNDESFIEFSRDTDLLVMHMPVPEGITGGGRQLHAPPSRLGEIADEAGAPVLLLSHFMARSLRDFEANIEQIRDHFDGEIIEANDLLCIALQ
jgi:ribonuclease BN (tRNA processing enzyme)